ncbi:MAG: RelA/SpoT domain-containing protein [Candidatus Tectomicrobia bacterium]|nr:RelA/SpoT domain-containing protein [Candidatus Tectomicrobia bacterium]
MNLEEYNLSGHDRYQRLAETIAQLLDRAINDEGGFRLQQIQHRAKAVESVALHLEQSGQVGTNEVETHRKDLAGCRIVFYTNNDVNRFANSGLLRELFDIDWERSKFHQPGPSQESATELFQSYNYVLKLKADRTALREYREFEGLYCEVQVQTTLNHAWAEMAHDTIYKRPDMRGFGGRQLEIIEKRLEDAMRKHLLPAGYLFQRIATDVQRLTEGKALFDEGVLDTVLEADNNNERYEALVRLKDDVLPHYDDLEEVYSEVRDKLKRAWMAAGAANTVPYVTPFGDFRGHESHQVTAQIAEIIEQYRYLDPHETYTFARDLYIRSSDTESRNQLIRLAERLASPTLQVWERYGPVVQEILAERLSEEQDIAPIAALATTIASKILEPNIAGTTWSSSAVTFRTGAIVHSDAIATARRKVIETIATYAETVTGQDEALKSAVNTLFESGRWPQSGSGSPELSAMILSDLAHVIERLIALAPRASLSARQDIEYQLLQYWRSNTSLPDYLPSTETVAEAHHMLVSNMISLRETLNRDADFVAFKTIVGFRSVFPHQWDEQRSDFTTDEAIRESRQDELADSITPENWSIWKSRLATAANVKSNDLATFPPYARFLSAVCERRPALAFELLSDRSILPDWTIRPIAYALLEGELRADVEALLRGWIDQGQFVREIAGLAVSTSNVNAALISKVAERATHDADEAACTALIAGAARHYADNPGFWRDEIFFPCLTVLQQAESHGWIDRSWHQQGHNSLFANLSADQCSVVLKAMLGMPRVDYQSEQILKSIASTKHQMVLDWLGRRVGIAAQDSSSNFEGTPFSFQSLHEALQPHPRSVISLVREWYDRGDGYGRWVTSRFLSQIYPNFEEPLPTVLLDIVDNADTEDLTFLASSLQGFDGRAGLLPVLRAILASAAANDEVSQVVYRVLLETGIMTGEFGAAQTYQAKADQLAPWLSDENSRVAEFAARAIHKFEMMVASENRRAQEEIAMRRLRYGESLDADDVES